MAGSFRQAMVFLGLADDGYDEVEPQERRAQPADRAPQHRAGPRTDAQPVGRGRGSSLSEDQDEDYVFEDDEETPTRAERDPEPAWAEEAPYDEPVPVPAERPSASNRTTKRRDDYRAPVTPINRAAAQSESDNELRRITTIHPRSYNDAKVIGESFRANIPVIMNVTDMDVAEAKRLVDFSSGLTFALNGSIERVTEQVFLLTPANLEVLASEDVRAEGADDDTFFNNQN